MSDRRRVLIVQPSMQPDGGGNAVAAWMLEALRGRHSIGLLTWERVDFAEMNRFYGTSLHDADVRIETMRKWLTVPANASPVTLALMKRALLFRAAATVAPAYDVLVSANNEVDFGRPGIQYVHYPSQKLPRPAEDLHWWQGPPPVLGAYYRLANRISRFTVEGMKRNLTLANSDWTARLLQQVHGVAAHTLYPPVGGRFAEVPWGERLDGFICVGRIAPEKEIERIIDIVARARQRLGPLTLCIVGTPGPRQYHDRIRARMTASGGWITLRENVSRAELLALMPRYKYGIHGRHEEHFGIAPAEMAAAGCIVFVPNGGGQIEIVNGDPRLIYESVEGAVSAIARVVESRDLQSALRQMLTARAQVFATERFITEFSTIVDKFPASSRVHQAS